MTSRTHPRGMGMTGRTVEYRVGGTEYSGIIVNAEGWPGLGRQFN
jgi:hypothetical protein